MAMKEYRFSPVDTFSQWKRWIEEKMEFLENENSLFHESFEQILDDSFTYTGYSDDDYFDLPPIEKELGCTKEELNHALLEDGWFELMVNNDGVECVLCTFSFSPRKEDQIRWAEEHGIDVDEDWCSGIETSKGKFFIEGNESTPDFIVYNYEYLPALYKVNRLLQKDFTTVDEFMENIDDTYFS